ncbi:MAG: hypothetical protein FWE31_02515 [Firmicutes bacterium]|nr:hypothetical protein [Bacillota bacterium]
MRIICRMLLGMGVFVLMIPLLLAGCGSDDMIIDRISVILTQEASVLHVDTEFTPGHFPEFDFKKVERHESGTIHISLSLWLSEPSRENTQAAVAALEGRSDISYAWVPPSDLVPRLASLWQYWAYIGAHIAIVSVIIGIAVSQTVIRKKRRENEKVDV